MAAAAFTLEQIHYRYVIHAYPEEIYIVLIALFFTALGLWAGARLTSSAVAPAFQQNTQAIAYLGLSARELEVLALVANGQSNKEIARSLHVSPNTVKTHLSKVYGKLDVQRRTQAVQKAKSLGLIR